MRKGVIVVALLLTGCGGQGIPQACVEALDTAEQVFDVSARFADLTTRIAYAAADGVTAAGSFDIGGLEAATAEVEQINIEINTLTAELDTLVPQYNSTSKSCRQGGDA